MMDNDRDPHDPLASEAFAAQAANEHMSNDQSVEEIAAEARRMFMYSDEEAAARDAGELYDSSGVLFWSSDQAARAFLTEEAYENYRNRSDEEYLREKGFSSFKELEAHQDALWARKLEEEEEEELRLINYNFDLIHQLGDNCYYSGDYEGALADLHPVSERLVRKYYEPPRRRPKTISLYDEPRHEEPHLGVLGSIAAIGFGFFASRAARNLRK
jgi:hypothetical protein